MFTDIVGYTAMMGKDEKKGVTGIAEKQRNSYRTDRKVQRYTHQGIGRRYDDQF